MSKKTGRITLEIPKYLGGGRVSTQSAEAAARCEGATEHRRFAGEPPIPTQSSDPTSTNPNPSSAPACISSTANFIPIPTPTLQAPSPQKDSTALPLNFIEQLEQKIDMGLQKIQRQLDMGLQKIEQKLERITGIVAAEQLRQRPRCLPLQTVEDIQSFENGPVDDYHSVVRYLTQLGGHSLKEAVRVCFDEALSGTVVLSHTWTGIHGTRPLYNTRIVRAIHGYGAVNVVPETALKAIKQRTRLPSSEPSGDAFVITNARTYWTGRDNDDDDDEENDYLYVENSDGAVFDYLCNENERKRRRRTVFDYQPVNNYM